MMNDASYFSGNNKFYKEAADIREQLKPTLAVPLRTALGNDSIGEDILDELLKKSDLLKELWVLQSIKSYNDASSGMLALHNVLRSVGDARYEFFSMYVPKTNNSFSG